jgi:hypothetical protein
MGALGLVTVAAQFATDWKWGPKDMANREPIDTSTPGSFGSRAAAGHLSASTLE